MSDQIATISTRRRWLFDLGIASACLAAVGVVFCFTDPFPLVHLPDGASMTNPWDDHVFVATIVVSILASALGAFGRGLSRALLIATGLILVFLTVGGYIQNHV
jgi:hypothetical protein